MLLHLPRSLNLMFDNIFRGDISVDSFVMSFGGEQEIVLQPVLIQKKCTVQKLRILNSNQLSGIENLDSSSTNPTVFFTGNAPKNLHVNK